jgi:hypothetical protein
MDSFIPKSAAKLFSRCRKGISGAAACATYPQRIPHEALIFRDCTGLLEKEQLPESSQARMPVSPRKGQRRKLTVSLLFTA